MLLLVFQRVLKLLFDQKFIPDFDGIAKTLPTFSAEIGGTDGTYIFLGASLLQCNWFFIWKDEEKSKRLKILDEAKDVLNVHTPIYCTSLLSCL